jgi:hypothetical protein
VFFLGLQMTEIFISFLTTTYEAVDQSWDALTPDEDSAMMISVPELGWRN